MSVRRESHITLDPAKLLSALNRRGLSAAQLAELADVSPTTLSGVLHHGRWVTVRSAKRIAKALAKVPPVDGLEDLLRDEVA